MRVQRSRFASLLLGAGSLAACAAGPADPPSAEPSHMPSHSPSSGSSPSAPADPTAVCDESGQSDPTLEIEVTTVSFAFDVEQIEGPRHCEPFVILFTNNDEPDLDLDGRGAMHDIDIRADHVLGPLLFDGDLIGGGEIRYEVPGLPAGTYYFYCSEHVGGMNGALIVASAS